MIVRNRRGYSLFAGLLVSACLFLVALAPATAAERQEELIVSSEIEGRRVIIPPDLELTLDWYAPYVRPENGRVVRGWVKKELILLETDKHTLICVERKDGTEKWRCDLLEAIRYEPAVSRNNVVVNVKNFLVAIHKRTGRIRWRLLPKFVMSNQALIIDPPAYPKKYTKKWQNMENIYTASWHGRMHSISIQGRIGFILKKGVTDLPAPEFSLYYDWHKTHIGRGLTTTPIRHYDGTLYYVTSDAKVRGVTRDAEFITPYMLQDAPATPLTVNAYNCYVGSRDFSLYALDRLTLRRKWTYAIGTAPTRVIYADEPGIESYVFVPTEKDGIHAVRVFGTRKKGQLQIPETSEFAWKLNAEGVVGASEKTVYLGSDLTKGFHGYRQIQAVDKQSGKVLWKSASKGVVFYLQFHNTWKNEDQAFRLYAVTKDNRLLAFKEKLAEHGPVAVKPVDKPAEKPAEEAKEKVPGEAVAQPE